MFWMVKTNNNMSKNTNLSFLTDYITADITNGRIGINNASPAYAFDVNGTMRTSGATYLATASGNVGIGTTTTEGVLTIKGTSAQPPTSGTTANSLLQLVGSLGAELNIGSNTVTGGYGSYIQASDNNLAVPYPLNLQPNGGNVGIGVAIPRSILEVQKTSGNTSLGVASGFNLLLSQGGAINEYSQIGLGYTNANSPGVIGFLTTDAAAYTSGALIFATRSATTDTVPSERMRITSGGSLLMAKNSVIGINTTDGSDDGYLALCGASGDGPTRGGTIILSGNERADEPGYVVLSAGNVIGIGSVITFRTAATERMRLIGNGRLLIGTSTDGGYLLYVNGNAAGTSGFANVSDGRFKKDITPIESALNKVKLLNGVSFNWDKTSRPDLALDDKNHLGLIAQEVEAILPQVVTTGEDEFETKTIIYSDIVPVLIEAIKEQQVQIQELSAKVTLLENK